MFHPTLHVQEVGSEIQRFSSFMLQNQLQRLRTEEVLRQQNSLKRCSEHEEEEEEEDESSNSTTSSPRLRHKEQQNSRYNSRLCLQSDVCVCVCIYI